MNDITVIIPVCAMPSHPSTEVLDEVLDELYKRLPGREIILMFDGVSPTLMHLKTQYEEYLQLMLQRIAAHPELNITPLIFDEHRHQSLMLEEAMALVRTPMILWSEQDTPLHNDIPFDDLAKVVLSGYANSIRFHHEATIPTDHQSLMLDESPIGVLGVPLIRTKQWSGRPHLTSTQFYRDIIAKYWTTRPEFIEHRMYGVVVDREFEEFRLHIYAPEGTYVRHKHTDGRRRGADHYDPTPS